MRRGTSVDGKSPACTLTRSALPRDGGWLERAGVWAKRTGTSRYVSLRLRPSQPARPAPSANSSNRRLCSLPTRRRETAGRDRVREVEWVGKLLSAPLASDSNPRHRPPRSLLPDFGTKPGCFQRKKFAFLPLWPASAFRARVVSLRRAFVGTKVVNTACLAAHSAVPPAPPPVLRRR